MKYHSLLITCFLIVFIKGFSQNVPNNQHDILEINKLNQLGYETRLTNPEQTLSLGKRAMALARAKHYQRGVAESHRIMGIGYYYLTQNEKAISNYLRALSLFSAINDSLGKAQVLNNIGNLYRDVDQEKGLYYFRESLELAQKLNIPNLVAGTYLNIGIIYYRKKAFYQALKNYNISYNIFSKLNNTTGIIGCLQNQGVIYFKLSQLSKAETLLLVANKKAKENELNNVVASINLTLTSLYTSQKKFDKAEQFLEEGKAYAELVKDPKMEQDYLYTSYELENSRGNYKKALFYLKEVYTQDSITFKNLESQKVTLFQEQAKQREELAQNQLRLEQEKRKTILFWASCIVLTLSCVVIILLVMNVKKKAKTNLQLQALNDEVSLQKENLDRINHNLEQIIAERTLDLQIKNKKLSAYSSHLSHQIRSPIATMKGLILLQQENLIEKEEFIKEMAKCVNEIDDKILNINKSLHDPDDHNL